MRRTLLAAFLLGAAVASASTPVPMSVSDRTHQSDRVVLADVVDTAVEVPNGDVRHMLTVTTLAVREDLKGSGPDRVHLVQLGGKSGDWELRVADDAHFQRGETVVAFLRCREPAHADRCTLLGLAQGKVAIIPGAGGHDALVPREAMQERRTLESVVDEIRHAGREVRR
jgi:hypothetical protein